MIEFVCRICRIILLNLPDAGRYRLPRYNHGKNNPFSDIKEGQIYWKVARRMFYLEYTPYKYTPYLGTWQKDTLDNLNTLHYADLMILLTFVISFGNWGSPELAGYWIAA